MKIISDLLDWVDDEEHFKLIVPLIGAALVIIILVVVFVMALHGITNTPDNPTDTPEPEAVITDTPTPAPTVQPTPNATVAPSIGNGSNSKIPPPAYNGSSYDDYILWVTEYYYKPNVTEPWHKGYVDPLSPDGYAQYMLWQKQTPSPTIQPAGSAYGVNIYNPCVTPVPSPKPCPTPDPYAVEKHTELNPADAYMVPSSYHTSTESGILAWDPGHSRGLYAYYYKGDVTAINLRFVNDQYKKPITNERVVLEIQKQVLGQYVTVVTQTHDYEYFVAPTYVDQYYGTVDTRNLTYFETGLITFPIPSSFQFGGVPVDTQGQYVIVVTVYVDDVQACKFSMDTCII